MDSECVKPQGRSIMMDWATLICKGALTRDYICYLRHLEGAVTIFSVGRMKLLLNLK